MLARKALAGTAAAPKTYVEDVFSTYLYSGNGTTSNPITNNIDISGKGGLLWIKRRNDTADHNLYDTVRGNSKLLSSNLTDAESTSTRLTFGTSGFTLTNDAAATNASGGTYASWTFRKAEKFFDVVTYTGDGASSKTISHNLGSTPGCIIVKCTSNSYGWRVYHRGTTNPAEGNVLQLNTTDAEIANGIWGNTAPTSINFTVGNGSSFPAVNASGETYVAYLFAHDAGGFGDAGDQSVIKCGSFTASSNLAVDLGFEPQFVMLKAISITGNWLIMDNMRGMPVGGNEALLRPNTDGAETATLNIIDPTSTGFTVIDGNGLVMTATYIYIAIRRGPMKTPTTGTDVYNAITRTGSGADVALTTVGFPVDWVISGDRTAGFTGYNAGRLTGKNASLLTTSTGSESTDATRFTAFDSMNGFSLGSSSAVNNASRNYVYWNFKRAPGFFDVVCYKGTLQDPSTINHNLGVAPEIIIVKNRYYGESFSNWFVYAAPIGANKLLYLNKTDAAVTDTTAWNNTVPTATQFKVGNYTGLIHENAVAYLFASCSGVSKVGSYTGNGSSVTVTTNFQPRFILVKRTDSTGNWIVSDSARGLVAGNDPYLLLNSTAAEDTDEDWVDITSTSFTVNETSASNANTNGGTYLYLAIA